MSLDSLSAARETGSTPVVDECKIGRRAVPVRAHTAAGFGCTVMSARAFGAFAHIVLRHSTSRLGRQRALSARHGTGLALRDETWWPQQRAQRSLSGRSGI